MDADKLHMELLKPSQKLSCLSKKIIRRNHFLNMESYSHERLIDGHTDKVSLMLDAQ